MSTDRDPFLADELDRITPPDHGAAFWGDLQEALATIPSGDPNPSGTNPVADTDDTAEVLAYTTSTPPQRCGRRSFPYIAVAAALLLVLGIAGAIMANRDDDTGVVTANPDPTGAPTAEPAPTPDVATPVPGDQLDLAGSVELGTSRDGASRLVAVPTAEPRGCEGLDSWMLYWVGGDDTARRASDVVFDNTPAYVPGPDGRVALRSACGDASSTLAVGIEEPAGVFGALTPITPTGWENAHVESVQWSDGMDCSPNAACRDGVLVAQVTRVDSLQRTSWQLTIDPDSGEALNIDAVGGGDCSASDLADPAFAVLNGAHTYNALASAIQAAALHCDYDAVAALAGDPFIYSFGGGTDFAQFIREAEARGGDPMAKLVRLLEVDPAVSSEDPNRVVWPAFFACETSCGIDLDEVARLGYTAEDVAGFDAFGGYLGYRMSFDLVPSGEADIWTWTMFVAGD